MSRPRRVSRPATRKIFIDNDRLRERFLSRTSRIQRADALSPYRKNTHHIGATLAADPVALGSNVAAAARRGRVPRPSLSAAPHPTPPAPGRAALQQSAGDAALGSMRGCLLRSGPLDRASDQGVEGDEPVGVAGLAAQDQLPQRHEDRGDRGGAGAEHLAEDLLDVGWLAAVLPVLLVERDRARGQVVELGGAVEIRHVAGVLARFAGEADAVLAREEQHVERARMEVDAAGALVVARP